MPEGRGTVMYLRDVIEAMDDIGSFVTGMTPTRPVCRNWTTGSA